MWVWTTLGSLPSQVDWPAGGNSRPADIGMPKDDPPFSCHWASSPQPERCVHSCLGSSVETPTRAAQTQSLLSGSAGSTPAPTAPSCWHRTWAPALHMPCPAAAARGRGKLKEMCPQSLKQRRLALVCQRDAPCASHLDHGLSAALIFFQCHFPPSPFNTFEHVRHKAIGRDQREGGTWVS